jgi:hypothetical protein
MVVYYFPKINLIEYQKIIFNDLWEDSHKILEKPSMN